MKEAFVSPSAAARVERAAAWLAKRSPSEQVLIVAANREAGAELVRQAVLDSDKGAAFGWNRVTTGRLAAEIAGDVVVAERLVPITRFATEGLVARVIQGLRGAGGLGHYAGVDQSLGFARAIASTVEELRLGLISPERVDQTAPDLAGIVGDVRGGARQCPARRPCSSIRDRNETAEGRRVSPMDRPSRLFFSTSLSRALEKPSSSPH